MHFSTLIFVTSTMAQAAFAVEAATIPGYDIVPLSWQIEVSPGQVEVLNGTVEEVIAQAVAINPAFKLPGRVPTPARAAKPRSLYRRAQVKFCNNFGSARVSAIAEGADRLHGLSGAPTLGPGPGQCSRVSCSYNSAIYWCNDNTFSTTVTWINLAESSYHITEVCPHHSSGYGDMVSGQNFEDGNWNTLVKEDSC